MLELAYLLERVKVRVRRSGERRAGKVERQVKGDMVGQAGRQAGRRGGEI